MELYKEILLKLLEKEELTVCFPDVKIDITELINSKCYQTLLQIKEILENHTLNDEECFSEIEKIVCLFEELGSNCKDRHDF